MQQKLTKIALVLDKGLNYWRGVLHGVLGYAHARPQWVLHSVADLSPGRLAMLRRWAPAGIVADVATPEAEAALAALGMPVVCVSHALAEQRFPRVGVDDEAIGTAVAQHYLERGIRHFAYFGRPDRADSRAQVHGFADAARTGGGTFHGEPTLPSSSQSGEWTSLDQILSDWLVPLPRPLGLMLWDDDWGLWLTQVCRVAGLRVPDDVAIVGVNDDRLNCELTSPPLSSIGVPRERLGHEAAALLDRLLAGDAPPTDPLLIPPLELSVRHSSDVLALDDPDLLAAVRFIHEKSHLHINVEDILKEVPIGRRVLERKFRGILGRSPLHEIRRARVNRAKRLLALTDATLRQVAERAGFETIYHLCRTFRKETGQTAMQYRRQFRMR
jgi:LacI family transcriptional regulator